jgi:hypothetical protein
VNEVDCDAFSKEDLIQLAKHQRNEMIKLEAINHHYMKHLERVIEHSSVERYRETVKGNNK